MPLVSLLLPPLVHQGTPQATPPRMTRERATQERVATIEGGGTLVVDGQALAFHPEQLLVSTGNPKTGRLVRLVGTLKPEEGAPWIFDLQVTEKGLIYMLQFHRKERGAETGRWSPTIKAKAEVLEFRPEAGGTVRLKFSGPLSGVLDNTPKQGRWEGELWASPK